MKKRTQRNKCKNKNNKNIKKNNKKVTRCKNKTKKNKYQKGGIDCTGIPENLPAYLVLGHGCNEIHEDEIEIPDNWIYITSGICGKSLFLDEKHSNFSNFFFKNTNDTKTILENPCTNFKKIQEFNDKPTNMEFNITFSSNVPKYQSIRKSYINSKFTLLSDWMYTNKLGNIVETKYESECTLYKFTRSGIYRGGNTPELTDSLNNLQIITISKKDTDSEIMIPFVYIEYIYLNSIYPTITQIKQRIKKLSSNISEDKDNEGVPLMVSLTIFKKTIQIYEITLSELFEIIKDFDKSGDNSKGAIIYNLTCREPCSKAEEIGSQLKTEIRRRKSMTALNTLIDD